MITFQDDIIISDTEKDYIIKKLPSEWETVIKEVNSLKDMQISLKINAKTIDEINEWINRFQEHTNTTYSVHNTRKCAGERLMYKKLYKCHHNTRRKETYDPIHRKHIKNTKCPSFLLVHMRVTGKRYRGKNQNDKPDPEKPCEIKINLNHNHSLTDGMASKFRRVLPEIRNELINLYKQGHTPATALQRLKTDIRMNYENYEEILADRSKCPDYRFCHYIYEKYIAKAQNQILLNEEFLKNKIENYNHVMNDICARMVEDETGYVICFCPPFVKRVHQYGTSSSTVAFIYSANISDKNGSKIYIILTYCEIGALPLGVIISTSKSTEILNTGFSLLKEMLNEVAFGRSIEGPEYFIVEEFLAQLNILNSIWPKSTILFSTSFFLKSIWRWLSSNSVKHHILPENKLTLFTDFCNMVYASTELDFIAKYNVAKSNALKYEQFYKLFNNYYDKRKQWAHCYRSNIFLRGCSTTETYSEQVFQIMKSKDLLQLKSFNIFQSVDFVMNNFFLYFEHRLLDAANIGTINSILEMKENMPSIEIIHKIKTINTNVHLVPSEKPKDLTYVVNSDLLTCTCFNGYPGTICKHIQWICQLVHSGLFKKRTFNVSLLKENFNKITKNVLENLINDDLNMQNIDYLDLKNEPEIIPMNSTQSDVNLFFDDAIIIQVDNNSSEENHKLIQEGKEIWNKMTQIYDNFLRNSPEQVISAVKAMSTNLEEIKTISDFCSACNNFGSQKSKIIQDMQLSNQEVSAATKLLLLSTENTHQIPEQTIVVHPKNNNDAIQNSSLSPHASESGLKRILLFSGNISCTERKTNKKIKLMSM